MLLAYIGHNYRLLVQILLFRHEQEIFIKPYLDIKKPTTTGTPDGNELPSKKWKIEMKINPIRLHIIQFSKHN